jgi:6-pyruvoyl-tetrahydropterin synthase
MTIVDLEPAADGHLTITRSFGFSASHELKRLPSTHKCSRNHGHNYSVTVSALVRDGVSGDLSPLGTYLKKTFDHRLLNDQIGFHPTSELLACHLADWFDDNIGSIEPMPLAAMVVSETPSTWARCDGTTREITIAKSFATSHGDVTLVLAADELDEFGFVTDFADLEPFKTYLHTPADGARLRDTGPALVAHLAGWFVDNVEPKIHGRLASVRLEARTTTGLWERGEAA